MDITKLYLKELENTNSTQEETVELIIRARNGDNEARETVLKNYLLHVVKIAREYINMGVPLADLISEGNLGLINAMEKYDIENGATFGSYSRYWIKQSIIRNCMHKKRIVRLPENISELLRSDRWKGSSDYKEFSIDMPYEDGGTLADKISDDYDNPFSQKEESLILKNKVENILSFLKKRDAEIVKAIYGIGREKPLDIEEAAELFSLTTTRINQVLRSSLKILRESQEKPEVKATLKIISAYYGVDESSINVTKEVTEMVQNEKCIKVGNKLAGDPCKGVPKHLFVKYTVGDKSYFKKFSEGSIVTF